MTLTSGLRVVCSFQTARLKQVRDDTQCRSVTLTTLVSTIAWHSRLVRLTEVAKLPVLQTVITRNFFFPSFARFSYSQSAPNLLICLFLSKSFACTA